MSFLQHKTSSDMGVSENWGVPFWESLIRGFCSIFWYRRGTPHVGNPRVQTSEEDIGAATACSKR